MIRLTSFALPVLGLVTLLLSAPAALAQSIFVGPEPYLSTADIPADFYSTGSPTALEDFLDCSLDHGITASAGTPYGHIGAGCTLSASVDSVDADDGVIDADGSAGYSWFHTSASVTFTFASPVTAAGVVWTDGAPAADTYFSAWGPGNVFLGEIGPFTIGDGGGNSNTLEDRFFGVKNLDGIEKIRVWSDVVNPMEVDHVQYGSSLVVSATWDDGQAIQATGGGLDPALVVGLEPLGGSAPVVTTPDSETVVITYSGLDPNEQLQINVASYALPFYPPDPIEVVGNQIRVEFDDNGTMATLTIDVTSSSGGLLDPLSVVGFNPQPEPPAPKTYVFDPPPGGPSEELAIQAPLSGGSGPAGGTQITLTLQILDDALAPLPTTPVPATTLPTIGALGVLVLAGTLAFAGRRIARR